MISLSSILGTVTFPSAVSVNSTTSALAITQTGTGNAFVVEDSTSTDVSPFVINASGQVVAGYTTPISTDNYAGNSIVPVLQIHGETLAYGALGAYVWNTTGSNGPNIILSRSASGTIGTRGAVANGNALGSVSFNGDDGTAFITGASINVLADGTPSTNSMPARMMFSTTAEGASAPTERMRIDKAGQVSIGTSAATAGTTFRLSKNITGAATAQAVNANGAIQSDVTGGAQIFRSSPITQATTFTLGSLDHFLVNPQAFGAGSTVTNQYGFNAASSLTGATNNYGFYGNIATGTGRYNFYAAGTAENYFAGNTTINVTDNVNAALRITQLGTGNALVVEDSTNPDSTPFVIDASGYVVAGYTNSSPATLPNTKLIQSHAVAGGAGYTATRWDNTGNGPQFIFGKSRGNAVGTLGIVADGDILGQILFAGDDGVDLVTSGAQITAYVDGTPGLNDMPGRLVFSTTADGASTPTERMRIDSAGQLTIGTTPLSGASIRSAKPITGGVNGYGMVSQGIVQSDVTSLTSNFYSQSNTVAATFTLPQYNHFIATQGTLGVGSSVTNQYGFNASSALNGATNNYGFYGNIAAGTGRYNFYAAGTAANYFAGDTSFASALTVTGITSLNGNLNMSTANASIELGSSTVNTPYIDFHTSASSIDYDVRLIASGGNSTVGSGVLTINAAGGVNCSGSIAATTTVSDAAGNLRSIPQNAKTTAYTIQASDNGKHIAITAGGINIPALTFSVGNAVTIYNNSNAAQSITTNAALTLYNAADGTTGTRTLGPKGIATILCVATREFVITGAGLT